MSLSKSTLSAIQQAGQALHRATVVVSGAVREQAEHMVSTVASQPFEAEGEQAFANFKMLARLSQDLQSLEEKLRALYANASELASPEMDVVNALPHTARSRAASSKDVAEDAVVKPASTRTARKSAKSANTRSASPAAKASDKASSKASEKSVNKPGKKSKAPALTANDNALLKYLQTALNSSSWTRLTGAAIAQGSGLPLGSVGVSLKRIMATGAVKRGVRGSFKLRG